MDKKSKTRPNKTPLSQWFYIGVIIQTIALLIWLISIPSDPKNNVFLGFSSSRWILISVMALSLTIITSLFINKKTWKVIQSKLNPLLNKTQPRWWFEAFSILLYISVFFPANNIPEYAAVLIRVRPIVLHFILLIAEIYFLFLKQDESIQYIKKVKKKIAQKVIIYRIASVIGLVMLVVLYVWHSGR